MLDCGKKRARLFCLLMIFTLLAVGCGNSGTTDKSLNMDQTDNHAENEDAGNGEIESEQIGNQGLLELEEEEKALVPIEVSM